MQPLVIDTNIALDLLVFDDPATRPLAEGLRAGQVQWLATLPMREELERVLGYPQVRKRLDARQRGAEEVLAAFDAQAQVVAPASKAPYVCGDPDDQKFVDLAVAHRALLLSKDGEVLRMKKRLARLDVATVRAWPVPVV